MLSAANRPQVKASVLELSLHRIGLMADVEDLYTSMFEDGCYEESAKLLLRCLSQIHKSGQARIDW